MTVSTRFPMLQGQELLDYVHANCARISASELASECGYPANQEAFRDALTAARLFNGEYKDSTDSPRFDVDLLEHLEQTLCVTQSECVDIARELENMGITDLRGYEDVFAYQSEEYNWESEFAQYWTEDVMCLSITDQLTFLVIDWKATWDCNLRYDFSTIEYSDGTIILHNN